MVEAAQRQNVPIEQNDILVVTQKIVSKAEGRIVRLEDIQPSPVALQLSEGHHKDPRHTEIILRESNRIVRMDRGNIICETRHGFNCANAGVDASNVPGEGTLALLPIDPDASAGKDPARCQEEVRDGGGRYHLRHFRPPWREGAINVAIGVAGASPIKDYRGKQDAYGQVMRTTVIAVADELASAAELVTGKVAGVPVALIKGYTCEPVDTLSSVKGARLLIRPPEHDMFR